MTNTDRFTNIPTELRERKQWVVWRGIDRGEKKADGSPKLSKVPFDAKTGKPASSTDPRTWCDFRTAVKAAPKYSGIGFVFSKDDPYVGIDLDNCRDAKTGQIEAWAQEIVGHFNTYAETSVSKTGVHLIVRDCHKPGDKCKKKGFGGHPGADVEIYEHGRYFCFTGELLSGKPEQVNSCQADMNWLYARLFGEEKSPSGNASHAHSKEPVMEASDAELIEIASKSKQGAKFQALWSGDMGAYGGDHSAADLGLMSILAFYTRKDAGRMDRLFRQSGLMREKWDKREDYRNWTIDRAISTCTEVYSPSRQKPESPSGDASRRERKARPDAPHVLYRLPDVKAAIRNDQTVYLTGSPADAEALVKLGLCGTSAPLVRNTAAIVAGYAQALRDGKVVILPQNSRTAQNYAVQVAQALREIASEVRIIHLPQLAQSATAKDWIASGGTREKLEQLTAGATIYQTDVRCSYTSKRRESVDVEFRRTELGTAERFIYEHGHDLKYNVDTGVWLCWDGQIWKPDHTGNVHRKICETVRGMYDILKHAGDQASKWFTHIQDCEKASGLSAIERLARLREGIPVRADDADSDPWIFNCANGTVDLRTGELRPHRKNDLITKLSPIEYDKNAKCETWERFLVDVFQGDVELISFIQRAVGYSLTGSTREQIFFILYGHGQNGKTTFLNALREITGQYSMQTSTDTIMEKKTPGGIPNDIARLAGARLVSAVEAEAGRKLAEELVKQLTGGDAVVARFMRQEFFEFTPQFKLWLLCNHRPNIHGQDNAIWRRIRMIPFEVRFREPGDPEGPYKDVDMSRKLEAEYPGILAWAVRGCQDWLKDGLGAPEAVLRATDKYQQEMDSLGGFLSERCIIMPQAHIKGQDLYAAYIKWAEANHEKPLTNKTFSVRLDERGNSFTKYLGGGRTYWRGIDLKSIDGTEDVEDVEDYFVQGELLASETPQNCDNPPQNVEDVEGCNQNHYLSHNDAPTEQYTEFGTTSSTSSTSDDFEEGTI